MRSRKTPILVMTAPEKAPEFQGERGAFCGWTPRGWLKNEEDSDPVRAPYPGAAFIDRSVDEL